MLIAVNSSNVRMHIDDANIGDNYYCPLCRQLLIQKKGQKRIHHFAHYNPRGKGEYTKCTDRWNYDKTEWHMEWQNRFPKECIEYVVSDGHKKHFADVLINQTVIEFQHSHITYEEFIERNDFYSRSGYKVIWIFDISDAWHNKKIEDYAHGGYKWLNPQRVFRRMDIKKEKATVFFQFNYDKSENECVLEKVTANYNYFKTFYTDINNSLSIKEFVDAVINNKPIIHKKEYVSQKEEDSSIEGGKTICELCDDNYSGMIVKNLSNGNIMCINIYDGSPQEYKNEIMGYYAKKQQGKNYYDINRTKRYAVWNSDKPIWQLIHFFPLSNEVKEKRRIQKEKQEQERLQRIKDQEELRQKQILAQQERERKRFEEYEERKRVEQEEKNKKKLEELEKKKKEEEDFINSLPTLLNQQDKIIKDKNGIRYARCKYCGKYASEKDFVYLGGKGENNLGTCRDCNKEGKTEILPEIADIINQSTIDGPQDNKPYDLEKCPNCGGKLIRIKGKYGDFLGCSNYPDCKFTTKWL